MQKRVLAWERHYPWVSRDMLEYFRSRVPRARRDSEEAIDYVVGHATSYELQERCVAALIRKTARYLLLYPERGLVLNPTAADVAKLCTGEHTVHAIVERLVEKYAPQPRDGVERDVMSFLAALTERGLMQADP